MCCIESRRKWLTVRERSSRIYRNSRALETLPERQYKVFPSQNFRVLTNESPEESVGPRNIVGPHNKLVESVLSSAPSKVLDRATHFGIAPRTTALSNGRPTDHTIPDEPPSRAGLSRNGRISRFSAAHLCFNDIFVCPETWQASFGSAVDPWSLHLDVVLTRHPSRSNL
ncbi:hypothetical protein P170DRAFT_476037 [Aspergillus steynii IBT 23096]|uniref:Uncharacterized protein n=1 Tax=Aspergillus steynii IBT 23096 TaxID=1392250 RepID=A0A2I2GA50_9EURO|nr:uncharacterized protein P170DRAFT_476037 [Aspergillus steynii IBT 23096]PLB49750.1 hypothetical protein P170DRAFT_476037 [Aspergillus steynii IBT 23096]